MLWKLQYKISKVYVGVLHANGAYKFWTGEPIKQVYWFQIPEMQNKP
jgi:hypothetical protein